MLPCRDGEIKLYKIAKIGLNHRFRICFQFSKCQYVVVDVQQCSLLCYTCTTTFSYWYHRLRPAKM